MERMEKYIYKTNILEYLEDSVDRDPDKLAYQDEFESLTFKEYMEACMRIGSGIKQFGLHKEPVAMLMDARHISHLKTSMGIVYSGCFYIPLDPASPTERIRTIFDKLNPSLVLYDEKGSVHKDALGDQYNFIDYKSLLDTPIDMEFLNKVRRESTTFDILFIMYTSGSTGVPKGAVHTHQQVKQYMEITVQLHKLDEHTIFGNQSPFFYANCVHEVYLPLLLGASVYVLPPTIHTFPHKMIEYLQKYKIESVLMTPSSFNAIAEAGVLEPGCLPCVKNLWPIGERMNYKMMKMWQAAAPGSMLWGFYGSTELLTAATSPVEGEYADDEVIPAGVPYRLEHVLIIGEDGQECPTGVTGEIFVNSMFMFSGYYKDPERTREVLVIDPLNMGWTETYFRTGDLGYLNEEGKLVVTGRKDSMIKHKGYRMELGEVEFAAMGTGKAGTCCCLLDREVEDGELFLFYTGSIKEKELRTALRRILPKYAVPENIIHMDQMPYNANRKADRQALARMIPNYKNE